MEKNVDRLTSALRALANEDADQAPATLAPRVIGALRTQHPAPSTQHPRGASTQHPAPSTQHSAPSTQHPQGAWSRPLGISIAATLAAALSGAMWFVRSGPPPLVGRSGSSRGIAPRGEIVTAFMPLAYSALPYTDARIVRLEVPRSALRNFGLAPADLLADAATVSQYTVLADVLVGEDGLARAVRFVRAERALGVAP